MFERNRAYLTNSYRLARIGFSFLVIQILSLPLHTSWSEESKSEGSEAKEKLIPIDKEVIDAIPSLGLIDAADFNLSPLKVPDIYAGDMLRTRIEISNGFAQELTIDGVKTSCGCTKAMYETKPLSPSSKMSVVLGVSPSKLGPYAIEVKIRTSLGAIPVRLTGKVEPKLRLLDGDAVYTSNGEFEIPLVVEDATIDESQLRFLTGDRVLQVKKRASGVKAVMLPANETASSLRRTIFPRVGKKELPPIMVSLKIPGAVELLTRTVVCVDGRCDLIFRADKKSIGSSTPTITQSGVEQKLSCKRIIKGSAVIFRCDTPSELHEGDAVVRLGKHKFDREVARQ